MSRRASIREFPLAALEPFIVLPVRWGNRLSLHRYVAELLSPDRGKSAANAAANRLRDRGLLTLQEADEVANILGLHPIEVWPDEYDNFLETA